MKALNLQIFDETISGTTPTWYSPAQYNDELGKHDQIGIQADVGEANGTAPSLTVQLQHSADGQHWISVGASVGDGPEISTPISANSTYFGMAVGGNPILLGFLRLCVNLGGTNPQCRLKLAVTGRDY